MTNIKHKYTIERLAFPIDGYNFDVQVLISVDGGERFGYCGIGKFCKTEKEAAEYIEQHKKENPDTEGEKETTEHPGKANTMCLNCGKFGGECRGTTEKVWTDCVFKTPKN